MLINIDYNSFTDFINTAFWLSIILLGVICTIVPIYIQLKKEKTMGKVNKTNLKKALKHADKAGAGASKRKNLKPATRKAAVKKEFKRGTLYTAQGKKVTSKGQAKAIKAAEGKAARK